MYQLHCVNNHWIFKPSDENFKHITPSIRNSRNIYKAKESVRPYEIRSMRVEYFIVTGKQDRGVGTPRGFTVGCPTFSTRFLLQL